MTIRVVYVSHNEIDNGLVRSQVLPYLRGLAERDVEVRLLTYERDGSSFPEGEFPRDRWTALRARRGTGLLAKAIDVAAGVVAVLRLVARHRADLVHARSYVPAAIALAVRILRGRPYVFDMRGFLPEEYVDVGYWTTGDVRYRVARLAERVLLAGAGGIVCPSTDAERRLRSAPEYRSATRAKPITVQPSMVDLDRFRPRPERAAVPTLVYSGSLGTWYMLDEMLAVYARARDLVPALRLLIVTRSDPAIVRDAVRRAHLEDTAITSRPAGYSEMPGLLGSSHVAIALVRQARSKLGASALKVAEYLACGLPVVLNAGLGDADGLVARYEAGHVVPSYAEPDLDRAAKAIADLLHDEQARANARRLAEEHFDLAVGVERYRALYAQILGVASGIMAR